MLMYQFQNVLAEEFREGLPSKDKFQNSLNNRGIIDEIYEQVLNL